MKKQQHAGKQGGTPGCLPGIRQVVAIVQAFGLGLMLQQTVLPDYVVLGFVVERGVFGQVRVNLSLGLSCQEFQQEFRTWVESLRGRGQRFTQAKGHVGRRHTCAQVIAIGHVRQ